MRLPALNAKAIAGLGIVVLLGAIALLAPLIAPTDPNAEVFAPNMAPDTRILVSAAPDPERAGDPGATAAIFTGEPPDLSVRIVGCPFQFRCPHVHEACRTLPVPTVTVADGRHVKCHLYAEGATPATPTSSSGLSRSLGRARPAGSARSGAAPRASG